jgi:TATA-box binding protein (TBP) (component of TFIID and TFIIIB)
LTKVKIVNVVATASVNQAIDFSELRKQKEIFHDSDVYGGRVAYFKTAKMEGKISIFQTGKMISGGATSECKAYEELNLAAIFLADIVNEPNR